MKKMTTLIFTILISIKCLAPCERVFYIEKAEPVYAFNIKDPVLRSFVRFESFYDEYAVNPVSGARGLLQYLPVMINEVNRILLECDFTHPLYNWNDAFDAQKSIDMWYIVQRYHNPSYDIQKACQIWFGLGVQYDGLTWIGYHKKIQEHLVI